jgi:hypothetical protein
MFESKWVELDRRKRSRLRVEIYVRGYVGYVMLQAMTTQEVWREEKIGVVVESRLRFDQEQQMPKDKKIKRIG